ncbi:MAG: response regulator transcription factor [Erythrobacter sp.]
MPNIILADDHDLVREAIVAYLTTIDGFEMASASNLDSALTAMGGMISFDLLILDYYMPGMNGLDGLEQVKKTFPDTKVILMSGVASRDVANAAMSCGADGFFPKSLPVASMVNAIKFVLSGERYFPFDFDAEPDDKPIDSMFQSLSKRELETLEQLCRGFSNKEIARKLEVQEVTVKLHVKNVLTKLKVSNRTQAALLAKERHLF